MNVTLSMYLIVCPLVFLAAVVDAIGGGYRFEVKP